MAGSLLLVPVLDLASHRSLGATARVRFSAERVELLAEYAMDAGDEVSVNYDADADYLDVFERYGLFDASAVIHTAEVPVAPEATTSAPGLEAAQREHVAALAERGCDADLGAWWIPDHNAASCPLYEAVRAGDCPHRGGGQRQAGGSRSGAPEQLPEHARGGYDGPGRCGERRGERAARCGRGGRAAPAHLREGCLCSQTRRATWKQERKQRPKHRVYNLLVRVVVT